MLDYDVFIVVNKSNNTIESIWSTKKLAKAAIHYHSQDCNLPCDSFEIIEREINKAKLKNK